MNIEIKSVTGKVLFEYDCEDNTIRKTLEEAVRRGANLQFADLVDAYLVGANLVGANLVDAYLVGANLRGANLGGAYLGGAYLGDANLGGANLGGAYLGDANLRGANLGGANLRDADLGGANLQFADLRNANLRGADLGDWGKIQSADDILIVGAIGSRNDYTTLFRTDKGIFVQCGCFNGSLEDFETKVKQTHQGNKHEKDYMAMIEFAKIKFEIK